MLAMGSALRCADFFRKREIFTIWKLDFHHDKEG